MYGEEDEFMPDDGDYGTSFGEAIRDVCMFLGHVLIALVPVAIVIAAIAYSIWREVLIINFLTG